MSDCSFLILSQPIKTFVTKIFLLKCFLNNNIIIILFEDICITYQWAADILLVRNIFRILNIQVFCLCSKTPLKVRYEISFPKRFIVILRNTKKFNYTREKLIQNFGNMSVEHAFSLLFGWFESACLNVFQKILS